MRYMFRLFDEYYSPLSCNSVVNNRNCVIVAHLAACNTKQIVQSPLNYSTSIVVLFPSLLNSPGLGICVFETKWTSPSARLSTIVAAMRGQSGALLVERMHDAMVEAKEAKHGRRTGKALRRMYCTNLR